MEEEEVWNENWEIQACMIDHTHTRARTHTRLLALTRINSLHFCFYVCANVCLGEEKSTSSMRPTVAMFAVQSLYRSNEKKF